MMPDRSGPLGALSATRSLWGLYLFIFLSSVCMNVATIFVPLRTIELGGSVSALGVVVAAFPLAGIFLSYPSGALSDVFGRPVMLVLSGLAVLAAVLCYAAASNVTLLLAGHLVLGLFDVLFWISAFTYVSDLADKVREAEAQSLGSAAFGLGGVLGSALGGAIAGLFSVRTVFVFLVLLATAALLLAIRMAARRPAVINWRTVWPAVRASFGQGLAQMAHNGGVRQACLLNIGGTWGWLSLGRSFYVAYLRLLMVPAAIIGLMATARGLGSVCGRLLFPSVSRWLGVRGAVVAGIIIGAVTLFATPFLTAVSVLALVGCLGEGVEALRVPGTVLGATGAANRENWALAIANVNLTAALGGTISPLLLGVIAERVSLQAAFWLGGAAIIIYTVVVAVVGRTAAAGKPVLSTRSGTTAE